MSIYEQLLIDKERLHTISRMAVRSSAWWDTHSSGKPVRARRDANRIRWSNYFQEFVLYKDGGNQLVVSKAVKKIVLYAEKNQDKDQQTLVDSLKSCVKSSVANHYNDMYLDYPTRNYGNEFIVFGSHSISLNEFITTVLRSCNLINT